MADKRYEEKRERERLNAERATARALLGKADATIRRMKHEQVERPKHSIKVRCCGGMHRVTMRTRGAVTFHDHRPGDFHSMHTLAGIAAEDWTQQGCLRVLDMVRRSDDEKAAGKLLVAISVAKDLHSSRTKRIDPPSRANQVLKLLHRLEGVYLKRLVDWMKVRAPLYEHGMSFVQLAAPKSLKRHSFNLPRLLNHKDRGVYLETYPRVLRAFGRGLGQLDDCFTIDIENPEAAEPYLVVLRMVDQKPFMWRAHARGSAGNWQLELLERLDREDIA